MLYVMLAGFPPFYGETENEVRREVLRRNFDFNDEEWQIISNEAKDLI